MATIKRKLKKKLNSLKRITKLLKKKKVSKLYFFKHFNFIKRVKKFQRRKGFFAYFYKLKENTTLLSSPSLKSRPVSLTSFVDGKTKKQVIYQKKRKNKWNVSRYYRYFIKFKAFRKLKLKKFYNLNKYNLIKAKYNLLENHNHLNNFNIPTTEQILTTKVTKYKPYKYKRFFKSSLHTFTYQFLAKQLINKIYGGINNALLAKVNKSKKIGIKRNELLLSILETRLDVLLFRMGFTNSLFESQQLLSHGFVYVNNKPIKAKDFYVEPSSLIEIKAPTQHLNNPNLNTQIKDFLTEQQENLELYKNQLNYVTKISNLHKKKANLLLVYKLLKIKDKPNSRTKQIILHRKIKSLLFLIKSTLVKKIRASYLKILSYLWMIYKPTYNSQSLGIQHSNLNSIFKKRKKFKKSKFNINKRRKLKKIIKLIKHLMNIKNNKFGVLSLKPLLPDWSLNTRLNVKEIKSKYVKPLNLKYLMYKYPKYLQINFKTKSAILLSIPKIEQIPLTIKLHNKLKFINQYLKIA